MKLAICSVFDKTAETFGRPFFAPNRASAVRSILSEVKNPESGMLHTHTADFDLFYLGEFDDQNGHFEIVEPERIFRGSDLTKD